MINLRECALNMLARREHSCVELKQKLMAKGYNPGEVGLQLAQLIQEGLQSDERFTETYVRVRVGAGFGPRRIEMELRQRGISDSLIHDHVYQDQEFWWRVLLSVWRKKYHTEQIASPKECAKRVRFLTQRGFNPEQVHRLLHAGVECS